MDIDRSRNFLCSSYSKCLHSLYVLGDVEESVEGLILITTYSVGVKPVIMTKLASRTEYLQTYFCLLKIITTDIIIIMIVVVVLLM